MADQPSFLQSILMNKLGIQAKTDEQLTLEYIRENYPTEFSEAHAKRHPMCNDVSKFADLCHAGKISAIRDYRSVTRDQTTPIKELVELFNA